MLPATSHQEQKILFFPFAMANGGLPLKYQLTISFLKTVQSFGFDSKKMFYVAATESSRAL